MQQLRKIIAATLVYVLFLVSVPNGVWAGVAEAATSLKKVTLDSEYYVMGASQYKNKTYIMGTSPKNWAQGPSVIVKNGTQTQTILPSSQTNYSNLLIDTTSKIYISPMFGTESSYGYIINKNTDKYEKKTLNQLYSPYVNYVKKKGYKIDTFSQGLTFKNELSWMVMSVFDPKTQNFGHAIVNKNGNGKMLVGEGIYFQAAQTDKSGNVFIIYSKFDAQWNETKRLIKIEPNGRETNYAIPSSIKYFDYSNFYIDNNNYLYFKDGKKVSVVTVKGSTLVVSKTLNVNIMFQDNQKRVWYETHNSSEFTYGYFNKSFGLNPQFKVDVKQKFYYYESPVVGISTYGSNIFAYGNLNFGLLITTPSEQPKVSPVKDYDKGVKGTAEPGSKITVTAGKNKYYATAGTKGTFEVKIPVQKAGTVLLVTATNSSKLASHPTKVTVLDKTPPSAPQVKQVKNGAKVVTGTAEPGATIIVKIGSKSFTSTVKTDKTFRVNISTVKAGTTLNVTVKDKAGNISKNVKVVVSK
jgi:hypothetical protein